MTLTDTGPILAILNTDDAEHQSCVAVGRGLQSVTLVTTWPCFTELMYLLYSVGGFGYQAKLWKLQQSGKVALLALTSDETDRMHALMRQYRDRPMDLADASLVAVAESRKFKLLFTLDSDFRFYRLRDGSVLEILP